MRVRDRLPLREKPFLQSAILFVLVFGVAMAPWPRLGRAFCEGYALVASAAFMPVFPAEAVTFRSSVAGDQHDEWDLLIRFRRRPGETVVHGIRVQLRRIAYVPLVFFAALSIAFPARDRRHRTAGIAGSVAALFVLQAVAIVAVFTSREVLSFGTALNLAIALISGGLVAAPVMSFAVPGLLWAILARPFDGVLLLRSRPSTG